MGGSVGHRDAVACWCSGRRRSEQWYHLAAATSAIVESAQHITCPEATHEHVASTGRAAKPLAPAATCVLLQAPRRWSRPEVRALLPGSSPSGITGVAGGGDACTQCAWALPFHVFTERKGRP